METRSKTSSGIEKLEPEPEFKRITLEQLEKEMGTVDYYDENEDEDLESFSSNSSTESGTDYDSVNTEDMSEEEEIQPEPKEKKEKQRRQKMDPDDPRRWLVNYYRKEDPSNGKRLTRSATTKEKKEELIIFGVEKEEPFKEVDPVEFETAMAAVDPYKEDEDGDFEMDDSEEESESESDFDSVRTEDMSEDEEIEEMVEEEHL